MLISKTIGKGFSLIEVMIVIAIIGIIAAIAYPSYQSSVEKSRRSDAKISLTEAAALQEKRYFQFNQYTNQIGDIGGATSKEGFYTIAVSQPCGDSSCFRLSATATGAQGGDTECLIFTLDNTRQKSSFSDSVGGTQTAGCW